MWLAELGKFVGAKVAGAVITIAVAAGGIWCYYNWDTVQGWGHVVKLVLVWLLVVAALPWTSFFYMRQLLDYQNLITSAKLANVVSVSLIGFYCLIDVAIALWLADWSITGAFTWFVVLLGFLAAGAYNFVICESLARHADS